MRTFDWGKHSGLPTTNNRNNKEWFRDMYLLTTPKVDSSVYTVNHNSLLFVFPDGELREFHTSAPIRGLRNKKMQRPIACFVANSISDKYLEQVIPPILEPGREKQVIMSKVGRVVTFDHGEERIHYLISSFKSNIFKIHKEGFLIV